MALDEEKLILFVNQYPGLYDLQNEHYMNSTRKSNIWKEIAKQMEVMDIVCKEKWKALRDSYHRNVKKRKCKSGDGATKSKKWKYESQMEFLRPYLQERATKSNMEDAGLITSDDNITNENSLPDLMAIFPKPVNSPPSSLSATSLMSKNITGRKKNQMADSIIDLLPDLQLKAKNKIYAIVSDLEYENILRNSTSSTEQAVTVTKETTPSTSDLNKRFLKPQNTPRSQPQDIQVEQVQIASDNLLHNFDNISDIATYDYPGGKDNESQSILEINPNTQTSYIITSGGLLLSH